MMDTHIKKIDAEKRNMLHILMEEEDGPTESEHRANII
jgi:hypothetical protein